MRTIVPCYNRSNVLLIFKWKPCGELCREDKNYRQRWRSFRLRVDCMKYTQYWHTYYNRFLWFLNHLELVVWNGYTKKGMCLTALCIVTCHTVRKMVYTCVEFCYHDAELFREDEKVHRTCFILIDGNIYDKEVAVGIVLGVAVVVNGWTEKFCIGSFESNIAALRKLDYCE